MCEILKSSMISNGYLRQQFGDTSGTFLEQLIFWINTKSGIVIDGERWIYNTQNQWAAVLGISRSTFCRAIKDLREKNLIHTKKLNHNKRNQTLYYSVNIEELRAYLRLQNNNVEKVAYSSMCNTKDDTIYTDIKLQKINKSNKENIGNFKNSGKVYRESKNPIAVLDHDFQMKELGKATPFGIYNIFQNRGFVNVGLSSDTAAFAVESVRRWWYAEGATIYANAPMIVITADCGGSNGYRNRLWKLELQGLANEISKPIWVLHYPPGTSKWNKIEHRLFSFITKNWQGIPLISFAVIVALIGATKTTKGLAVRCILDENIYEAGRKVTDSELDAVNICHDDFHGEWNYVISPIEKQCV